MRTTYHQRYRLLKRFFPQIANFDHKKTFLLLLFVKTASMELGFLYSYRSVSSTSTVCTRNEHASFCNHNAHLCFTFHMRIYSYCYSIEHETISINFVLGKKRTVKQDLIL